MGRLLVSGSLAYDRILDFNGVFAEHILPEKIHQLSVSFFVPNLTESYGGNAGNIAYTLALLGAKPAVVSTAGNDFAPYEAWLQEHGVDLSLVERDAEHRTAFATIMTDTKDNQITAFYPGAMLSAYPLDELALSKDDFVIVGTSNPDTLRALPALCRERGVHGFLFDPGQQIPTLSGDDLKNGIEGTAALTVNDYELELVKEKTGWSEGDILEHAEALVVTLGEQGSRITTKEATIDIPAAKTTGVVDPTGAGDAYRAGFVAARAKGLSLEIAGKAGSVAACYAIEATGTQNHSFTTEEFATRYAENFNETITL
ncbi:MAG: carbohydrate kinase family protein [Patescibacteria group bacterium]|nr:carbohydrate kinase family protein [Patescibacteria group bacterium]